MFSPFFDEKRKLSLQEQINKLNKIVSDLETENSKIASKTQLGKVKIGNNISVTNEGVIDVPVLDSTVSLGLAGAPQYIKQENITTAYGVIGRTNSGQILALPATKQTGGVIIPGTGLSVNKGTVSIDTTWLTTFVENVINPVNSEE